MAIRAFISYSHKDADLLTQLHEHLSALQRQELLEAWTDREIHAGGLIDEHVHEQLEEAELYLFLISSAFIQSDYCFEREFGRACERQKAGKAIIVPIIVRECDWNIPALRRYKALPEDGKPVISHHWHNTDAAFANVAAGLRMLIQQKPFLAARKKSAKTRSLPAASRIQVPKREICPLGLQLPSVKHLPETFTLTTKKDMPQWADYRELSLMGGRLQAFRCDIQTESPYFRFGLKLLSEKERLFGDGSIKSQDANLVVHIGRNNWSRTNPGISSADIFFTWYLNGISTEGDKKLFAAQEDFSASIQLVIDTSYMASFSVNGVSCLKQLVPPGICGRLAVLAWGDREEYSVEVSKLSIGAVPSHI